MEREGLSLLSDRYGDVPGWTSVIRTSTSAQPGSPLHYSSWGWYSTLKHKRAVYSHAPLALPTQLDPLLSVFQQISLVGRGNTEMSFHSHYLEQMGQEGHFIPKFIGPWASSGVANPSLSSHSSFWALAHSSSPSSLSWAGSFISARLPHPLSSPHFRHQGGVWRSSRHYWWSICLDMVRGSVACGRAAGGGFEQGETLCHITCLDMSCSLVCMPVWDAPTEAHTCQKAAPAL